MKAIVGNGLGINNEALRKMRIPPTKRHGMEFFLGFDCGTYESKGVLTDSKGVVYARARAKHDVIMPKPGHVEHDPLGTWYDDFKTVVKELIKQAGISSESIACIGISTVMAGVTAVDINGDPLRNAILYGIDSRSEPQAAALNEKIGVENIAKLSGRACTVESFGPKILWIKENEPEVFEKTHKFTFDAGFLVSKLTGNYCVDAYSAVFAEPMIDSKNRCWYEPYVNHICSINQLPEIRETTDIVGTVTKKAAEETGLHEGTKVICGTTDAGAEAISVGIINHGDLMIMYGSTMFFIAITDSLNLKSKIWSSYYPLSGLYCRLGGMATTGSITRWLRDNFAKDLLLRESQGESAYDLLFREMESVPVGSNGLMVLPYFQGERMPIQDPNARGMIIGLTLSHKRGDLLNAICEGTAFGLNQNIELMQSENVRIKRAIAIGGGAQNRSWLQIVSNVLNIPQMVPAITDGAAYGNALLAALAAGQMDYESLNSIIQYKETIQPNPVAHQEYLKLQNMFNEIYPHNKTFMHELSSWNG